MRTATNTRFLLFTAVSVLLSPLPILGNPGDSCTGTPHNCTSLVDSWSCISVAGCDWDGSLSFGSCSGTARPCSTRSTFDRKFCEDQGCLFLEAEYTTTAPAPTPNLRGGGSLSKQEQVLVGVVIIWMLAAAVRTAAVIRRRKLAAEEQQGTQSSR